MDSVAKTGRPKFNPRPGWGLNPGPSGLQSEILPTVPTSHVSYQSQRSCQLFQPWLAHIYERRKTG